MCCSLLLPIGVVAQQSVSGTITLQNATNHAVPLTLDFCATDRPLLITRSLTPAANGGFTVTDIPKGTYTLSVKGARWLRKNVSVSTLNGNVTGLNVGALKGGDAYENNAVDVLDLDQLIQSFDKCQGDPGYLPSADFNNSGCVDVLDLDILIQNFDTTGEAYATRLQASGVPNGVALTWVASPQAPSFTVYRATSLNGTYDLVATGVAGTTYTYTYGAMETGIRYFKVAPSGGTWFSNIASAGKQPASLLDIDTAQPGWAEDIIPTDSPATVGAGPSSATSIDVATGILENRPGPDILARNPVGISPSFSRLYRSAQAARGYPSPGLTAGWTHNYDLYVQPVTLNPNTWVNLRLTYPNGATEVWTPNVQNPNGALTPQTPGTPYCVMGDASTTVGRWDSLTIIYKDLSTLVFEPSASNPHLYLLKRMTNAAGRALFLNYGAGNVLTSITNDANPSQTLLTLNYTGTLMKVTDVPGVREVNYHFGGIPNSSLTGLLWVSQINSALNKQWEYKYEALGTPAWPLLTQVGVLDPINPANGIKFYPVSQHDSIGRITTFADANNNKRIYNFHGGYTEVEARRADNTLDLVWHQAYDGVGADLGTTDAKGYHSGVVYGDMQNPKKPSRLINRNGQSTDIERDGYGNITLIKTPFKNQNVTQILVTELTYDYSLSLAGKLLSVREGNLSIPSYKTPTTFTYYGDNVFIGGVLQPRGLLRSVTEPVPGTTNGSTQTAVEYIYTAIGSIRQINTPGPNNGATISTVYEYLDDSTFTPEPASRTTEVLDEPLRITFPRNNSFATASIHLRYDARGNVVRAYDELGKLTEFEYYDTNSLKKVIFPPTTADPTKRASIVYTYQHPDGSGSVLFAAVYSEDGTLLRQVNRNAGNEDEFKFLSGPVVQAFPQYDALYRQTGMKNGKNILAQQYGYDEAGNYTGVTYANATTTRFTKFDAEGNTTERTDGRNRATTYDLAPEDSSLRRILYPDSTHNVVLDYDNFGRISSVTDRTGIRTYQYDHLDNVTQVTLNYFAPNGVPLPTQVIDYVYYTDGTLQYLNLTTQDTLGGNPVVWTTYYQYNPDGTQKRIELPWEYFQVSGQSSTGDVDFTYDAKGRLTQILETRLKTEYAYNTRDFLIGLKNTSLQTGNPAISTFGSLTTPAQYITYDAQGLPISVPYTLKVTTTNDSSGAITYFYDDKFRLSGEQRTLAAAGGTMYNIPFTLDDANNLTNVRGNTFPPNNADQINLSTFIYDDNGTLRQSRGQQRLSDGTTGGVYDYNLDYDYEDRPVSIGNIVESFTLDGQRAWKQVGAGERTYFLYDGDTLLAELDSQMRLRAFYGMTDAGLLQRYTQQFPNSNSAGRFVRFYAYDPNGHLANRVRHNDYTFNWPAASTSIYDAYGGLWYDWGLPTGGFNPPGTNIWFNSPDAIGGFGQFGDYTDIESRPTQNLTTPLVLMGDQHYDGQTGRFQTRSGDLNEYSPNSNPIGGTPQFWVDMQWLDDLIEQGLEAAMQAREAVRPPGVVEVGVGGGRLTGAEKAWLRQAIQRIRGKLGGPQHQINNTDKVAAEYHKLLRNQNPSKYKNTTTAAAGANISGQQRIVISNSSGYLSREQRIVARVLGHVRIKGPKLHDNEHAEEIMVRIGELKGYNFRGQPIGASHSQGICRPCEVKVLIPRRMIPHSPIAKGPLGRGRL